MHENSENLNGIYHVTNTGDPVSWADFARNIFKHSNSKSKQPVEIENVLTKNYETKAARPAYSVLDTSSYEKAFGVALPDWRTGLELAMAEWQEKTR